MNIIVHVQVKFADLKFTVIARSKQTSKHTHAQRNEVTLVWGSLRFAPINYIIYAAQLFPYQECNQSPNSEMQQSSTCLTTLTYAPSRDINPLTTEFFPPRQHLFMHSAHTTFVGTPLPQHSLLSGQTWWGPHTWRDPSGNTVNDPPQGQQSEVKGGCQTDFRPAFP